METIFMNTENSKTNEPHRFRSSLADKLNLKNPNKNIALGNLSIYYTWKNIKHYHNHATTINFKTLNKHATTINLKFLLQLGIILLICLMVLILLVIFKATLNLSSENMKL